MSGPGEELLERVAAGAHYDPHAVLGVHQAPGGWVLRVRLPLAATVATRFADGSASQLRHIRAGIWEGAAPGPDIAYVIEAGYEQGTQHIADDPYRFGPTIGEFDLHLIAHGRH